MAVPAAGVTASAEEEARALGLGQVATAAAVDGQEQPACVDRTVEFTGG